MTTQYETRCEKNCLEKQYIGLYIAYYLRKNACQQPVAVGGGSTNLQVLRAIHQDVKDQRSTVSQVLTNHLAGIYLAIDLNEYTLTNWYCTGGLLRVSRADFIEGAEKAIQDRGFWMSVVGANGFLPPSLSTATSREHPVKKAMIDKAINSVILPIDSSKWGKPAGQHFITIDEIVSSDKKVILVTCFPVQDLENDESQDGLIERSNRFLDAISQLTQQWQYNLTVSTAPVSAGEVEFTATEIECKPRSIASEVRRAYAQLVSPGQERQIGLIVRFDLWGNPR